MLRHSASIFFLLAALALAGCGNNPHPPATRETRDDGTPWRARYSWLPSEPKSLDPQNAYDQASRGILEPIYDTLVEYHPFKTDPYQVVPCMLEAMPEKEPLPGGGVALRCRLKKGILFHDDVCFPGGKGREVTAHDVYYTFQRMTDPSVECPIISTLGEYVEGMWENFQAAKKTRDKLDYALPLAGLEVLGEYEFRIRLKRPYPQMLYWMAMQFCSPVAREAVEYYDQKKYGAARESFSFHPVGQGAFMWSPGCYTRGQRIKLLANPLYITTTFPADSFPAGREEICRPLAGHALPLVDEMNILYIKELLPVWLLTKQGYLDKYGVQKDAFNAVVTNTYGLSPELAARGMKLEKDTEVGAFYTLVNMSKPVLGKNKKLRQALSCAYDAARFSEIFYEGVRPVCEQLIPPGLFGYRKEFKNPYGHDLERAKRLIAEAGYPGGRDAAGQQLTLELDFNAESSDLRKHAEFEKDCYEALGIRIQIIEDTFSRLMQKQETGDFQLASGSGWGADYPDPENFLMIFYSKNMPPEGKNETQFRNEEFDRLYEQMATMDDTPERLKIVHRMADILAEECPIILNTEKSYFVLVQPWAPRTHDNTQLEGGVKFLPLDPVLRAQCIVQWNRPRYWPLWAGIGVIVLGAGYAIRRSRRANV